MGLQLKSPAKAARDGARIVASPVIGPSKTSAEKGYQRTKTVLREAQSISLPCAPMDMEKPKRPLDPVNHVTVPTPSSPWQAVKRCKKLPDRQAESACAC